MQVFKVQIVSRLTSIFIGFWGTGIKTVLRIGHTVYSGSVAHEVYHTLTHAYSPTNAC
jgi:hypothetical protein